jgi:secondary thiamine-phosphate synthase enzyme
MRMVRHRLKIATNGQGLKEITGAVADWALAQRMREGLLTVYLPHSSASLLIQENAAAEVRADLEDFFRSLAPEELHRYRHIEEGADDMPAHIRAALLPTHLALPLVEGKLALGRWQGIYLFEHRHAPHHRDVLLHLIGD